MNDFPSRTKSPEAEERQPGWIKRETNAARFADERLARRSGVVLRQLAEANAASLPWACGDWANSKAAYRFFDNDRVSEADILSGHFHATRERFPRTECPVLVLHDTCEISYRRENIGILRTPKHGPGDIWRKEHPMCGISMHSSLSVTTGGLPLGLSSVKFWTRKAFKGTNALKRKINPTRVPIEEKESLRWLENVRQTDALLGDSTRCVHIGDRGADIYELFCAAAEADAKFLIRICVDRLAGDEGGTMEAMIATVPVKGVHRLKVRDDDGVETDAELELKYLAMKVRPPKDKQKRYPDLNLTLIHAIEKGTPANRAPVRWKLFTNLTVDTPASAVEKLDWYAMRWKIEVFHKILKSGCKIEHSRLRTAERLVKLIATCCIIGWRIFWMTMINRTQPDAEPMVALTPEEVCVLDRVFPPKPGAPKSAENLSVYLVKIARLGGFLARARDGSPGNIVMWRGLARLADLVEGFSLKESLVGN